MAGLDSDNLLDRLGLDQDALQAQAHFYTAYARMLEVQRSAPQLGGIWERMTSSSEAWIGPSSLASAYRLAAQYTAIFDPLTATDLSIRAGLLYLDADLPFGLFLLAGLLDDDLLQDAQVFPALSPALHRVIARPTSADPVQETYLALAMASRPWLQDELGLSAQALLDELSAHELVPVGPQSIPLAVYLTLAATMLRDGRVGDATLPEQLAVLGRAQSASLKVAMRNQYLWERGAAPVNILDLEYMAMSGLAMRSGTNTPEQIYQETTDALRDDPLAELPVFAMRQIDQVLPQVDEQTVQLFRPDANGLFADATATPRENYRPPGGSADRPGTYPKEAAGPQGPGTPGAFGEIGGGRSASNRDRRLWNPYDQGRRGRNSAGEPDGDDGNGNGSAI